MLKGGNKSLSIAGKLYFLFCIRFHLNVYLSISWHFAILLKVAIEDCTDIQIIILRWRNNRSDYFNWRNTDTRALRSKVSMSPNYILLTLMKTKNKKIWIRLLKCNAKNLLCTCRFTLLGIVRIAGLRICLYSHESLRVKLIFLNWNINTLFKS